MAGIDEQNAVADAAPAQAVTSLDDKRKSLLDRLGEQHTEIKKERHLDADIPGYDGMLFARFRPYNVNDKKAEVLRKKQERGQPIILDAAIDNLIESCEQLFVRDDDGKELPIDDQIPVQFEKRLAQLLKFDDPYINTARDVVKQLFPTQQAILKVSAEISEWLANATQESDKDFLEN